MRRTSHPWLAALLTVVAAATLAAQSQEGFSFRSGVELINVTATVTDDDGRFVSGLRKDDFIVFENGERQEVTHFSNERVPVSLGIVLDASGSMTPDKMSAARSAIDRFIATCSARTTSSSSSSSPTARPRPEWTTDRRAISRAVARVCRLPAGRRCDAIADALPLASIGRHPKKALLVISDGNDTNSSVSVGELRQLIRESEVLVYALGVDGTAAATIRTPTIQLPFPVPFPIPGRGPQRRLPPIIGGGGTGTRVRPRSVNAEALRPITDDTAAPEVVRGFGDLDSDGAIADELASSTAV
jgi:hypothetical protein